MAKKKKRKKAKRAKPKLKFKPKPAICAYEPGTGYEIKLAIWGIIAMIVIVVLVLYFTGML
ncbi:hypothetical protein KY346_05265 [Candidatus Woesearchaeota archaeon]|nr:hypothetical protein [Candidatus Woesearchaeota archaeon]